LAQAARVVRSKIAPPEHLLVLIAGLSPVSEALQAVGQ